jgi:outer membrane protein OmpA-like peptidoglycan-associated protein
MLRNQIVVKRGSKGEAEKPFWISYADLMTALMVLFLVAMSVAMLAVTNSVKQIEQKNDELQRTADALRVLQKTPIELEIERQKAERDRDIDKLLDEVTRAAGRYVGVKVDKGQNIIDFGDRAHFDKGKNTLTSEQARLLRAFVPEVLAVARDELGRKWLKQVVVEGFASPEGDYLYNLNLSLQRSQRVLCVLLAQPYPDEHAMSQRELEQIRDLFLVGGYSFNAAKFNAITASYDESRRVELRLEFLGIGESRPSTEAAPRGSFGQCALGG